MAISGWPLRLMRLSMLGLCLLSCSGCGLGYLWHVAVGQATIFARQRPVDEVLREAQLTPREQEKLRLILAARTFAITHLDLYDSASYTTFVQLDRPYVSYNLSAAPPDALTPYTWRFPLLGSMPYKGFFDQEYAKREQHALDAEGYDTYLRGVRAYSTLGYFDDPILSSMLAYDDVPLINTIIHEMVHQTVWIKGSVSFNESLASFIGERGALLYLTQRDGADSAAVQQYRAVRADALVFEDYMHGLITRLEAMYAEPLSRDEKLRRKATMFAEAVADYPQVFPRMRTMSYRHFFERQPLNNAVLLAFRVYHRDTAYFDQTLAEQGGDLRRLIAYFKTVRAEQIPAQFRTR
jgi:predicted aminopeptidase